jgi:hypothetical protein
MSDAGTRNLERIEYREIEMSWLCDLAERFLIGKYYQDGGKWIFPEHEEELGIVRSIRRSIQKDIVG